MSDISEKIRRAIRPLPPGTALNLVPFDVEQILHDWREQHRLGE